LVVLWWGGQVEVFEAELSEVDLGVVVAAEETEVVDDGFAAVDPPDDVVDVAPFRGAATAVGDTVAVSDGDSPAQTCRYHPGFTSVVE
jgi:hypothetical protein